MPRLTDFTRSVLLLAAVTLTAVAGSATTISTSSSSFALAASSTDLLQTDLGSVVTAGSIGFASGGTSAEPVLRDGLNPNNLPNNFGGGPVNEAATALAATGAQATYFSPFGWDISSIDTYGHWDEGRDRQDIEIEYALLSDPMTFIPLTSYSFDPPSGQNFSKVSVTPTSGSFLATGVAGLRFKFPNQENAFGGYREIDVFGVALVPEPGTAALLGSGLVLVAAFRRLDHLRE